MKNDSRLTARSNTVQSGLLHAVTVSRHATRNELVLHNLESPPITQSLSLSLSLLLFLQDTQAAQAEGATPGIQGREDSRVNQASRVRALHPY